MLNRYWSSSKITNGKPRHPETQGSVESVNKDIKRHFTALLYKRQSTCWVEHLEEVQYIKNTSYSSGSGISPFQALFYTKPPISLSQQGIPDEVASSIVTEGDYEQVVNEINQTSPQALIPPLHIPSYSLETSYESEQDINNNLFQSNYTDTYLEDISQPACVYSNSPAYVTLDYSSKFPPVTSSCPDIDNYTNSTVHEIQPTASRSMVCPVCQLDTCSHHLRS